MAFSDVAFDRAFSDVAYDGASSDVAFDGASSGVDFGVTFDGTRLFGRQWFSDFRYRYSEFWTQYIL